MSHFVFLLILLELMLFSYIFRQSVQDNGGVFLAIMDLPSLAVRILDHLMKEDSYVNQRGRRYIFLIIKSLETIKLALNNDTNACNYARCLEVFYRTIPDPFVSQGDMKGFLRFLLAMPPFIFDNLAVIAAIYNSYFLLAPMLYSPRSLKHLSRISVRHILRKNDKLLPHSVRRLHIPRELHDYLLCIEPMSI